MDSTLALLEWMDDTVLYDCGNGNGYHSYWSNKEIAPMKILGIYDQSGPKYHRIFLPLQLMEGIEFNITQYITNEEMLQGVDIVFYNRGISWISLQTLLNLRAKHGFKTVCDLDDHWTLDKGHILYNHYKEHHMTEKIMANVKEADCVTVTHERLRDEALTLNTNVHILPNAIPNAFQFQIEKDPDEYIRLFWAGGVTHLRDLELLRRAFERIDRTEVKFVMGGYHDGQEWYQMANVYTNNGRWNHKVINSLPVTDYYKMYRQCDISLVPLVETAFNIHKSNLKILEAANCSSPVIVSKVHPYLDVPDDVVNYVDGGNKTWFNQITRLVKDKNLREDQGAKLKEYCNINFNFAEINKERRQIFEAVKHSEVRAVPVRA